MAQTTACLEISVKWKALNFCGIHFPPPSRQVYYQISRIVSTASFPSPVSFNTIHITNPGAQGLYEVVAAKVNASLACERKAQTTPSKGVKTHPMGWGKGGWN